MSHPFGVSLLRPNALLSLSAPLLLLLTAAPPHVQARILRLLPQKISKDRIVTSLTWALAPGLGAQINTWLSELARNNWVWRNGGLGRATAFGADGWDKEVVVITGGANGIGELTVKSLASKGMKVAVLDIVEPTYKCEFCVALRAMSPPKLHL
jgi:hypothetical protein